MPAVTKDLFIEQGATFKVSFTWRKESTVTPGEPGDPYDLTGAIARMQIRKAQGQPALVTATSTNGKITLGGTAGTVDVVLTDDDTDLLTSKTGLYDLEIELASGEVYRLLKGKVTVDPNITQETEDPVVT